MVYPQFSYAMEDVRLRQQALEDKFDAELDSIDNRRFICMAKDKALAVKFITDFSINQREQQQKVEKNRRIFDGKTS